MLRFVPVFLLLATLLWRVEDARAQDVARREIVGSVRDANGLPVPSAEVRVDGTQIRVISDANGTFVIRNPPESDLRLIVRRLGFRPRASDVVVERNRVTEVAVVLDPTPAKLEPVVVAARPEVFDARLTGFYSRMENKAGHYITPERLKNLSSHRFSDVIREVPGVRVLSSGRNAFTRSIRLRGANCAPVVFMDGVPAHAGEFDIDIIEPSTIEGVEVYHGSATIPVQFSTSTVGDRCGVIAFWSRPYRPPPRKVKEQKVLPSELAASNKVFTAETVDLAAAPKPRSVVPVYPDSLWREKVAGRVMVEFIVDTTGRVEAGSLGVVTTSHVLFSEAAMDAVAAAEFHPAFKAGRPVRQVVQLPVVFEPATGNPAQTEKKP